MSLAVVDTTVLSNFARLRCAELVQRAFPQLEATEGVRAEILEGQRLGYLAESDWSWLPIRALTASQRLDAELLGQRFGRGEAECLVIAVEARALLLTDDRAARQEAARLGLSVSGTLGVLARLHKSCGISLDEAESLLSQMIAAGYRSPVGSLGVLLL